MHVNPISNPLCLFMLVLLKNSCSLRQFVPVSWIHVYIASPHQFTHPLIHVARPESVCVWGSSNLQTQSAFNLTLELKQLLWAGVLYVNYAVTELRTPRTHIRDCSSTKNINIYRRYNMINRRDEKQHG